MRRLVGNKIDPWKVRISLKSKAVFGPGCYNRLFKKEFFCDTPQGRRHYTIIQGNSTPWLPSETLRGRGGQMSIARFGLGRSFLTAAEAYQSTLLIWKLRFSSKAHATVPSFAPLPRQHYWLCPQANSLRKNQSNHFGNLGTDKHRPEGPEICQPRSEVIFASSSMTKIAVGLGRSRDLTKSEERSDPRRAKFNPIPRGGYSCR